MKESKAAALPEPGRRPLLRRHLAVVLVVKVLLLIGLWQVFVKPHRVVVSADQAAVHIAETHNHINQGE
jgi:hypothetical protein